MIMTPELWLNELEATCMSIHADLRFLQEDEPDTDQPALASIYRHLKDLLSDVEDLTSDVVEAYDTRLRSSTLLPSAQHLGGHMGFWHGERTEHAGAKNGGGHWGKRAWAKWISRKLRRSKDKWISRNAEKDYE